jgi:hypothetical protein
MSEGARTRCPRRSASQFRRWLYGAVITGNAAQAGPGLITRTLDRLQAFDDAFLRRREAQPSPFPESVLYAAAGALIAMGLSSRTANPSLPAPKPNPHGAFLLHTG